MKKKVFLCLLCLCLIIPVCTMAQTPPLDTPAVSPQDLLKPDAFPEAQFGMSVESAVDGPVAKVVTTGGEFIIDKAKDTIECRQRISKQRSIGMIELVKGSLGGISLSSKTSGAAIFSGQGTTVRISGDSLLMVQPGKDGNLKASLSFVPDYYREFSGNYNFFDPDGGISFFEHGKYPNSILNALKDPVTVTWPWKAGDVFWASVSPPKPYDWDYPLKNRKVMQGSSEDRFMFPSDAQIVAWHNYGFGNIVYLSSEMQWKNWQTDLTPKNPDELHRVVNTAHEFGMKVMVYCSPLYFVKNTPNEHRAGPVGNHAAWPTGSNEPLYLEFLSRLIKEHNVDGVFFDGMYQNRACNSLATNYHLARSARAIVGDNGLTEFHSTTNEFGDGHFGVYCPTLHAYFSFILRGEGEYHRIDPAYIRYYASTYNISNSTAAWCFYNQPPSPDMLDRIIKANIHLHLPELFLDTGDDEIYRKQYWPRLTPSLKDEISGDLAKRVGMFDQFRKSIRNKRPIEGRNMQ